MKPFFFALGLTTLFFPNFAFARGSSGTTTEDNFMISNGQGVSSPSFWDGINGANPAGLVYNSSIKLQAGAATFDDSTQNIRESGGLLLGNGNLGAGLEYSKYSSTPYPQNQAQINGGLAARLPFVNTTFGVSAHSVTPDGTRTYDAGMITELWPRLNFGAMIKDFTHGMHEVASGLTFAADPMLDLVVDAAYQITEKEGAVKPGITIHTSLLQLSAAYGLRMTGNQDDDFLTRKLSAGLGLKLTQNILIEYQYKVLPEHWLGVTLRMN